MRCTLRQWQNLVKPRESLLYNCSEFSHLNDEWTTFPIGMGYTFINFGAPLETAQIGTHERLVLCAFNVGTDVRRRPSGINRRSIRDTLALSNIQNISLPSAQYFTALPTYKFVISPEGNGIDCHRHYEALMAGCIPIVEEHRGIREKYGNCPILFTRDYSEITPEFLERTYLNMLDTAWDFSRLLLESYSHEEKAEIKANGNYWGSRLTHKVWY